MEMDIHQITFSPTGGTRRVCEYICEDIGTRPIVTDLCVKEGQIRLPDIHEEDLVIIAMPVFAGRVPALAVERLKRIQSNRAKCAVVAVYGNRAYDDTLLEMQDVATEMGFRVVAAGSAVAEHSIARVYAAGRPDAEDRKELVAFGAAIINKAEGTDTQAFGVARQPSIQGRQHGILPHGRRAVYRLRHVSGTLSCRRHTRRQSQKRQQGSLHLLYALPLRLSDKSKEHRTSGDDGDRETENVVRHEKKQ